MRDAQKDLEICNKATPGPWKQNNIYISKTDELDDFEIEVKVPRYFSSEEQLISIHEQAWNNAKFIAEAREALPYWIQRAQRLKKALIKACEYLNEHGLIMSSPYENDDGVTSWYQYFLDKAREGNTK